jgi:phosphohistidine phosphatase SixA
MSPGAPRPSRPSRPKSSGDQPSGLRLDLLRHGQAVMSHPDGDDARPLTPRGREDLGRLAEVLRVEGTPYDRVFASPLARAMESAGIVTRDRLPPGGIEPLPELRPETEPGRVLDALGRLGVTRGRVLLVAHQPLLGRLVEGLTGSDVEFAPATLVRLKVTSTERGFAGWFEWEWKAAPGRPAGS